MDWALARGFSSHRFLRNRLLFRPVHVYYVAMATNLVARFVWILTINSSWCYAGRFVTCAHAVLLMLATF